MIQLTNESATYIKWQLEQIADELTRFAKAARQRASRNVVAKPGEEYLAAALDRARAELVRAYKGVNPKEHADG